MKLLSAGDETISESLFLSNVYPYAKVQQVLYSNGDRLMVWVGDNPDRTDGNRSALYYSFYQQADGVWSDPALVTSEANGSGTADFYPALICENDTAHLVWCDAEIPQSGTAGETVELETLQAHMRALNIGYARFDRNEAAFADYAMLEGMEDSADVQPSVTVVNGQPVVVWASNSAGDLMLADGTTNLYSAELTESGWVQTVLESSVSGIDGIAATEEDEGLAVYYTRQSDGLTNDLTARELYRYFEEKTEAVTDNEVPDCGPTVQTNRLSWYQDGAIRTKDRVLLPEANEIGDSYQYLRNSTGTEAILYSALTDAESDALYARFCEDTVHWGEPVLLAEATSFHDFSGVLLADGTLAVVASRTVEDGESSTTDLVYYKAEPVCDLAVVSAKYDPFSLGEQRMLSVLLDVENLSSASVHETEIRFYDGVTLLGTDFSATPIVSGAKTTLDVVCPLSELEQVPASLRVEVVPVEIEDPVEENNSAEILLNLTDLSLEAMYAENVLTASGDSTIVTVCAVNRGVTETAPASLALHLDAADGIVPVPEQEIPALEAGASAMLVFQLEEPLAEGDVLYAVAEELDRENIAANNSIFTMIQTVDYGAAGIFTHNVFAEKSEQGVTVMLQADNTSAAGVSVYFLTAAYSGEEMLDANIEDVQLSANTEGWSKAVFLDAKTADTVKVFLLNKDFRPISGVKVVDLP